ncbi:MAG: aldo/keto reductase [Acidobacteriota bacterium]|nr:aldo/keto reductase [Acidobacteriota bacterium]MDE3044485.1 aldo/keto reductase [Acidobacteriota bacterium]MDE3223202.1 aldo/keto reductase [Acidobacteriota bacterium]
MEQRPLGSLQVSVVGLGCNNFGLRLDEAATRGVVDAALDAGVNFFDTADVYGGEQSEVLLGRALGSRRSEVVIATKFGMPLDDARFGAKPAYVKSACAASLRRLGTDYLDLYQLHYPDETVPIEETLGALRELVDAGYVREIGCSNLNPEQLRAARAAAGDGPAFISVQNQYSLLAREPERDGVLETCRDLDLGFLPFYPLANGLLTGKVRPGEAAPEGTRLATMAPERRAHWWSDALLEKVGSLLDYATSIDTPILTLAFSWLLSHPEVRSVIAGASSGEQIRANVAAATTLDARVIARLDELTSA